MAYIICTTCSGVKIIVIGNDVTQDCQDCDNNGRMWIDDDE